MKRFFALMLLCAVALMSFVSCDSPDDAPDGIESGVLSSFSAEDLDGKAYDQSVLKGKKVTMINVWGTFCGPCISEMPDLGELNKKYADQGFQIIGIAIDVVDMNGNKVASKIDDAKEIIAATGADYLHLLPSESLNNAFLADVMAVPMTIFVDENGNMLGEEHLGSKSMADWESVITSLLGDAK